MPDNATESESIHMGYGNIMSWAGRNLFPEREREGERAIKISAITLRGSMCTYPDRDQPGEAPGNHSRQAH